MNVFLFRKIFYSCSPSTMKKKKCKRVHRFLENATHENSLANSFLLTFNTVLLLCVWRQMEISFFAVPVQLSVETIVYLSIVI